jgi:hypothetical protein
MVDKSDIISEMREAEKLQKIENIFNEGNRKFENIKNKNKEKFELEDDLDDIWFSLWNSI